MLNQNQNTQTVSQAAAAIMLGIKAPVKQKPEREVKRWAHPEVFQGKLKMALPDYARFKMIINFKNGKDPKGYKMFPSLDYNGDTGITNEREGLKYLWDLLTNPDKYKGQWHKVTMWMSNTNCEVKGKNHNVEMWHLIDGNWVRKRSVFFKKIPLERCSIHTKEELFNVKVDLIETFKNWA